MSQPDGLRAHKEGENLPSPKPKPPEPGPPEDLTAGDPGEPSTEASPPAAPASSGPQDQGLSAGDARAIGQRQLAYQVHQIVNLVHQAKSSMEAIDTRAWQLFDDEDIGDTAMAALALLHDAYRRSLAVEVMLAR